MAIKITALTAMNMDALRQCYRDDEYPPKLTAQTATFTGTKARTLKHIDAALRTASHLGPLNAHPYKTLQTVKRKIERATES